MPTNLTSLENLARDQLNSGRFEEALRTLQEVRETVVAELGPCNVRVARILDRIADGYEGLGALASAQEVLEEALEMRTSLFEDAHAEVFNGMDRLVGVAARRREGARALELLRRMLKARATQFGIEHPATLAVVFRQAGVCLELGRIQQAEQMAQRVATLREKMLGGQNALTAASFVLLGQIYERQERVQEARDLLERGLAVQRKLLGETHEQVRATGALLERVCARLPAPTEAAEALAPPVDAEADGGAAPLMDVLAVVAARAAEDEPPPVPVETSPAPVEPPPPPKPPAKAGTLALVFRQAETCFSAGKLEQAEAMASRVAGSRDDVLATENPLVAAGNVLLGRIYELKGRLEEARDRLERGLTAQRRILGAAAEEVLVTQALLESVSRALGIELPVEEASPPEIDCGPPPAPADPVADLLERLQSQLKGDLSQALADIDAALVVEEVAPLLNARGVVLMRLGEPTEALHDFARAGSLDSRYDTARFNRGLVFLELGQEDDAHGAFSEAISLAPERVEAYVQRALIDIRRGREEAALRDLAQAISADYLTVLIASPNVATIGQEVTALRRGLMSLFEGEPSEAWWDFDELLAGNPQNAHAHGLRALASMRMGEAEMALDSLAEVKGAAPRLQALLFCARALALHMEGKSDRSRRELWKARRAVPEFLGPALRF